MITTKQNKLEELVSNAICIYDSEEDYLNNNDLASQFTSKEWEHMKDQGYSDDGTLQIDCAIWNGNKILPIRSIKDITELVLAEIEESDFNDIVELLNDECESPEEKTDPNDIYQVVELFIEYCSEISVFKQTRGEYKGGLCIVFDED